MLDNALSKVLPPLVLDNNALVDGVRLEKFLELVD
jgi:hypothetical protein